MRWIWPVVAALLASGCADPLSTTADVSDDPCTEGCSLLIEADGPALVEVYWDGTRQAGFRGTIDGEPMRAGHGVLQLEVGSGPHTALLYGEGTPEVDVLPLSGADLLPDLVTLVPTDVHIGGCSYYERTEQGATRCLRLSNAVGNTGRGPLEVRLGTVDGILSLVGGGQFTQRIFSDGGSFRDEPVAGAEFHPTHIHFHYAELATFHLHAYDLETGLRGEEVAAGKKSGFCFIDIGQMEEYDGPRAYDATGCFLPAGAWVMGVSVGWFDLYVSGLDEQYIDIPDVPDGVYELVSTADGADTLQEVSERNNSASVVLRIEGNEVEVLDTRGLHRMPA